MLDIPVVREDPCSQVRYTCYENERGACPGVVTLRLADRWVRNFWAAREDAQYHVFYLQATREHV